ncbi:MAG: DNA polymerase III subunit gamma/tau [Thermodesulfobacteriota bacterium]
MASSYLVLARKYRPNRFSEVVGQHHVIQTLCNSLTSGRIAHAFLFCGVRGVGKTTVARIFAKALNCADRDPDSGEPCNKCSSCREITDGISMDVQEIDGASHTSVDNIREINENIKYPPVGALHKIIIIDEVHMISINAFNALLKTLEEPPSHAKFIFATTESHKVPATIKSRCQTFAFRTVPIKEMIDGTARILEQEGLQATDQALALIAREAQGSFRDALSLLDQVASFGDGRITEELVRENLGVAGRDCFGRLTAMIRDRNPADALALLHELFQQGYDPEQFVLDMIRYMRNLIVVKAVPPHKRADGMIDAAPAELDEMEQLAQAGSVQEFHNMLNMLVRGESELKRTGNPWIALEMTILRMTLAPELVDLSELVRRMDSAPLAHAPTHVAPPAPRPARKAVTPGRGRPAESAPPATRAVTEDVIPPKGRFVIEKAIPLPQGSPAEVWSELKERIRVECQEHALAAIMDHGTLITFGPGTVEIGFNKSFYQEEFDEKLQTKPAVRQVFDDLFGNANIKVLTLAQETALKTETPYPQPADGQTDRGRALIHEARENPVVRAVLEEFEDSSIEDIRVITPK